MAAAMASIALDVALRHDQHAHAAHYPASAPVAFGSERRGRLQCGDAVTSSAIDPMLHTPPAHGLDHAPT